jgi:hypothetical protein
MFASPSRRCSAQHCVRQPRYPERLGPEALRPSIATGLPFSNEAFICIRHTFYKIPGLLSLDIIKVFLPFG